MRNLVVLFALGCLFLVAGCSESSAPVLSGKVVSGMVWDYPVGTQTSNKATALTRDARVDVYERILVVHYPDGDHVVPLENVSALVVK